MDRPRRLDDDDVGPVVQQSAMEIVSVPPQGLRDELAVGDDALNEIMIANRK